ncbi:uncharacterized protein FTOL_10100 [Fusarium torulosum]|uniref:Methyltransferase n=1 Tax=Fusarium torulosum TaxID=33205 RepID=A0AAE8MGR2_9HYPO|nr:uncharacterized protein FTOL_10100 [Fusarium torulosum]
MGWAKVYRLLQIGTNATARSSESRTVRRTRSIRQKRVTSSSTLFSTSRRDGSTYSKIHRAIARRPSKARNRKDICAPDTPRINTTSQPLSAEGHEFALIGVSSSQMGIGKHVLLHRNTEDHPDPPTGAFCRKIQEIGTPGAEVGGKVSLHTQCYKPLKPQPPSQSREMPPFPFFEHCVDVDLADHQVPRKLQDFYFYYGRWYGKNGNLPREKYIFPIDQEELARLDILHKFFLVVRKNNLFSASLDVEQPLRVLDLGTGTGIWAIELSDQYPRMHVQGLDFNMIQPKMIPRTMAPPKPFDLEGSWDTIDRNWDFMHVRTLFGSIQNWPDLYKKMMMHLKPGRGCMEQVEIDWAPQCDDDSLPTDSALSQWASKLLDAMDQYGRPMRVNPEKTRQQLALAGFVDISETVIRACFNPWPEDITEKEAARWFNAGLSSGLTALSCAAMS